MVTRAVWGSRAPRQATRAALLTLAVGVSVVPAKGQDIESDSGPAVCSEGIVSGIELDRKSVFDPDATDVRAVAWTYRTMNLLHVRTAPSFIRRELLFEEGDCFDPFLVSESERLLDAYDFMSQAAITTEDDEDGGRRVLVSTQDEWSTQLDVGVTYDGGPNLERLSVREENFLGQGVFAEFTHRDRRETRLNSFSLSTPRFFGRADAGIAWGKARPGSFFRQHLRYPFIGETGEYSFRQGYGRGTQFFSYSTEGAGGISQVLLPAYRELIEFSAARRFGEPGKSFIVGLSLTRDVADFRSAPQVILVDDFDDLQDFPGELPPPLARQITPSAATRLALQLGTRRFHYRAYEGLDGIRDRMVVSLGFFAGVTIGRGFSVLEKDGVPGVDDLFGRVHGSFGAAAGSSLFHGRATVETRRDDGRWKDVLGDADVVAYLRDDDLKSHTLFLRASVAGGWSTTLPYQLSLGGREGVRSLVEDRFPGGRMARFVAEDRVVLPWPSAGTADLGLTLFTDVGRVWPGDVPYALDSGWQAAVGFGLRVGFPSGSRQAWRTDVAFPVGPTGGSPIFRFAIELNSLRAGFFSPDVSRSRRFNLGAEDF